MDDYNINTLCMYTRAWTQSNECVTGTHIIQLVLVRHCRHWSTDNACTCNTRCMEQRAGEMEMQSTATVQIQQISQSPSQQKNTA